ncbi:MAG: TolC family protein [Candidatus Omnitrophica bacterium]|nr:TolC family protein [Candidatus Omnitrophota bacterium]
MLKKSRRLSSFLSFLFILLWPALVASEGVIKLTDIGVQEIGRVSQITLKTSAPVDLLDFKLTNPPRVVLDLVGENIYSMANDTLLFDRGSIKEIRSGFYRKEPSDVYPGRKVDSVTVELRADALYRISKENGNIIVEVEQGEGVEAFLTPRPAPAPSSFFLKSLPSQKRSAEEELEVLTKKIWSSKLGPADRLPGATFLSLEECIQIGLSNHGAVKVAEEQARLARVRVAEARRGLYPTASVKWTETRGEAGLTTADFLGREFTAEAQQLLFDGGRALALYKQAEVNYEILQATYDRLLADARFDITQAYYNFARLKHVVKTTRAAVGEAEGDLERNRRRFDLGLNRPLDLLAVESQYRDLVNRAQALERDLVLAHLALAQAMSLPPTQSIDIEGLLGYEETAVTLESAIFLGLANRPEIELGELLVQFNQFGKEAAESLDKLQVNVTGSLGRRAEIFEVQDLNLKTEWFLGLNVSHPWGPNTISSESITQDRLPAVGQFTSTKFKSHTLRLSLFDRLKSGKVEASVRLDEAMEELERTKRIVTFEIQQAFYDYRRAVDQIRGTGLEVAFAEESAKVVRAQAGLDEARVQDLFDTAARLLQVKTTYLEALANYHIAVAALNRAVGVEGYFRSKKEKVREVPLTQKARRLIRAREEFWEKSPGEGLPPGEPARVIYVNPRKDFVIINRGKKDGVLIEMPFVLMRKGEKVADIKVLRVAEDLAACDIVSMETIQPVQLLDEVQPRRTYGLQRETEASSGK